MRVPARSAPHQPGVVRAGGRRVARLASRWAAPAAAAPRSGAPRSGAPGVLRSAVPARRAPPRAGQAPDPPRSWSPAQRTARPCRNSATPSVNSTPADFPSRKTPLVSSSQRWASPCAGAGPRPASDSHPSAAAPEPPVRDGLRKPRGRARSRPLPGSGCRAGPSGRRWECWRAGVARRSRKNWRRWRGMRRLVPDSGLPAGGRRGRGLWAARGGRCWASPHAGAGPRPASDSHPSAAAPEPPVRDGLREPRGRARSRPLPGSGCRAGPSGWQWVCWPACVARRAGEAPRPVPELGMPAAERCGRALPAAQGGLLEGKRRHGAAARSRPTGTWSCSGGPKSGAAPAPAATRCDGRCGQARWAPDSSATARAPARR